MLESIKEVFQNREIFASLNLTMDDEILFSGSALKIINDLKNKTITKAEYIIIIKPL
jgi:16S rRNA C1402 (ribose-2'-O) methylase RsmI